VAEFADKRKLDFFQHYCICIIFSKLWCYSRTLGKLIKSAPSSDDKPRVIIVE
jgi:hypothetical protein